MNSHAMTSLAGVEAANEFFAPVFASADKDVFAVALCDTQARAFALLSYPEGPQLAEIPVQPLLSKAESSGCAGIVVAHYYARAWGRPIAADLDLANKLVNAAEPLDITLVDYMLFGDPPPFSFRRAGIL